MKNAKQIAICAMIAAMYTALCLALAPLSFGPMQARVAEALTLLPVFSPLGIWGVTLGCGVSNFVGYLTGTNILGFVDIFVGTAATLFAAILSYRLRGVRWFGLPVAAALPPVIVNAIVIGAELAVVTAPPGQFWQWFPVFILSVAAGQAVSCIGLGLLLVVCLEKTGVSKVLCTN